MDIRNAFFSSVLLHFSSLSGYTVTHHRRYRYSPARRQRGKQQQPFPSVFHCHALKIALKQLHHGQLNKWIYTLLKAFSCRHSVTQDLTQRKVRYLNSARLPVTLTQRPFAGSCLGHRPWAQEGRINRNLGIEHLIPLPSFPQPFPRLPVQFGV